jgi:hypothetical protein
VADHRDAIRVDQFGVCRDQLVDDERHVGRPAIGQLAPELQSSDAFAGHAGRDPAVRKARRDVFVRVVDRDDRVAVAGEVLGERGECAARLGVTGGQHDQRQRAPERLGVGESIGADGTQHVQRHTGQARVAQEQS